MRRWRWGPVALATLGVMGSLPVAGAVKVQPGQECVYVGTVERKETAPGRPPRLLRAAVRFTALITQAEPAAGYSAVVMGVVAPSPRQDPPGSSVYADLSTVRYRADLSRASAWPRALARDPLGGIIQVVDVPFAPGLALKAGDWWFTTEHHWALLSQGFQVFYQKAGETRVGDRTCLKIVKKLLQQAPEEIRKNAGVIQPTRRDFGGGDSEELIEYEETLLIDPVTAEVVSDQMRARKREGSEKEMRTFDLSAGVTLEESRQLSATELAARVRQVEMLDRVQRTERLSPFESGTLASLGEATKALAAFRREFPGSPYAPAVAAIEGSLSETRRDAERVARQQALEGAAAPDFTLKNLSGDEETLGAYRGKLILLNFFASW